MRESLIADQMFSSAALQAKSWETRLNRRPQPVCFGFRRLIVKRDRPTKAVGSIQLLSFNPFQFKLVRFAMRVRRSFRRGAWALSPS
jgi:hypothetical protein